MNTGDFVFRQKKRQKFMLKSGLDDLGSLLSKVIGIVDICLHGNLRCISNKRRKGLYIRSILQNKCGKRMTKAMDMKARIDTCNETVSAVL